MYYQTPRVLSNPTEEKSFSFQGLYTQTILLKRSLTVATQFSLFVQDFDT